VYSSRFHPDGWKFELLFIDCFRRFEIIRMFSSSQEHLSIFRPDVWCFDAKSTGLFSSLKSKPDMQPLKPDVNWLPVNLETFPGNPPKYILIENRNNMVVICRCLWKFYTRNLCRQYLLFNSHIVYILYNTIFASEIFAWFMKVLNSIGGVVYECSKENSEVFSSFMDVLKFRHGNWRESINEISEEFAWFKRIFEFRRGNW